MRVQIYQASSTVEHLAAARELIRQHIAGVAPTPSCHDPDFGAELAGLPGEYAPPRGRLLLVMVNGEPAGCVALRPIAVHTCEMKRLFVLPAYRAQGLGRRLAERILAEARSVGCYSTMKLDTDPRMQAAIGLYRSLGFAPCPNYNHNPFPEAVFMELSL